MLIYFAVLSERVALLRKQVESLGNALKQQEHQSRQKGTSDMVHVTELRLITFERRTTSQYSST